jgi:integrase
LGDIDWNGRFPTVQHNLVRGPITSPKSHQPRRVDLTPQLVIATDVAPRPADALVQKRPADAGLGVPSLTGTPLEHCNLRHTFGRLLKHAGLRQIRIHDLRHTYASLLLQAGAPITYVSHQLGHRDASITLREYAHWLPDGPNGRRIVSTHCTPMQPPRNQIAILAIRESAERLAGEEVLVGRGLAGVPTRMPKSVIATR